MENKEVIEISRKIMDLFITSKSSNDSNKWILLRDYHTRYLNSDDVSPVLLSTYHSVTSEILDSLTPTSFNDLSEEKILDNLFLQSVHHEAFMILVQKLETCSPSYLQQKILNLLEQFLKKQNMYLLIAHHCVSHGACHPEYLAASKTWNDLITFIVSLPERVANKTKGQMSKIFHIETYIPLLASSILRALTSVHQKMGESKDCTLEFIGKLVGKLCILGHGDVIAKNIYLALVRRCEYDFLWRRISQNLIAKIPLTSLEPFMTHLLLIIPWYGYVDWVLGDDGMTNKKLSFIMTTKLLLFRHFKQELILQNIIGYYASSNTRRPHFWKILSSLITTWSDPNALNHQSLEQQKYLAFALIICAGWIKMKDVSESKVYVDAVLQGTMHRIGNSEEFVRNIGMIVSDLLISALNPMAPKFEYEDVIDKKMVAEFRSMMIIPNDPGLDSFCYTEDLNCFKEEKPGKVQSSVIEKNEGGVKPEIESDDDLEPYDMSNDIPQEETKRPYYLLDCFHGLMEQEKPEWFEQCLKHAESLIEQNADTVHEVAVEMAKVMLHLEDKFSTPNFLMIRHRILVSLTVHCPILVAEYLSSQFYEDDYNIRQRLDILEILAVSSQQLSQPKETVTVPQPQPSKEAFSVHAEKSWQSIVNERVAAKTRYITKTPRKPSPEMVENRFSPVAGYFFFPLMVKYDKKNKRLQLFGEDSYVLGRLIYTLGTVMCAASNIPISEKMGSTLLKFLADVRNHADVFVRQASIFSTAAVYTSVPGYLLFSDMTNDVMESQKWLQSVIENDPDTNCQVRASYALAVILRIMKEEVPLMPEILNS